MDKLSDGDYWLGLMPRNGEEAKLVWSFSIYQNKISDDNLAFTSCIEFILRSGQCSLEKINPAYKYLILKQ
jgi:hypothetical protein